MNHLVHSSHLLAAKLQTEHSSQAEMGVTQKMLHPATETRRTAEVAICTKHVIMHQWGA